MSARETAVTFAAAADSAVDVARLVAEHLAAEGVECSEPLPFESGARLTGRVGRRAVPLLVGPAPEQLAGGPGRWFVAIGSALMPLARLIGVKDDRAGLTDAVTAALRAAPGVDHVRWHDADSWSGRTPPGRRPPA